MRDSIVYNNLLSKNYLNLSYTQLNSPKQIRRLLSRLAIALNEKKTDFIKKIKKNYSAFDAITVISLFVTSTSHSIESPTSNSKIFTISFGTPTRNEFDFGLAMPTLDLYLNIIIPLLSFYLDIYLPVKLYIIILFKSNLKRNIYILRSK